MQFTLLTVALLLAGPGTAATAEDSTPQKSSCQASCCSNDTAPSNTQAQWREIIAEAGITFVANLLEQVDTEAPLCAGCKEEAVGESPVRKALRATLRDLIKSKTVQAALFAAPQSTTHVRHAVAEQSAHDPAGKRRSLHLRKIAQRLDGLATSLDNEQFGDDAAELRETAERLRSEAREAKQAAQRRSAHDEAGDTDDDADDNDAGDSDNGEVPAPPKALQSDASQVRRHVSEFDIDIEVTPALVREDHRKWPRRIFLTSAVVPEDADVEESPTMEQLRGQVRELRQLVYRLQRDVKRLQSR